MQHQTAIDLRDQLAAGTLTATALVEACLAKIACRDPEVGAWAWLDTESARREAAILDARHAAGKTLAPLHGVPVGIKDIIDTAGIPTENGCVLDAGRVPNIDAALVANLKAAGAIILGKTVTTELANRGPGKTRNPHNLAHTPGGSSSGSAAAVAAGMVPLAVGTQTAGSVIRPASYCGVVGFKPSFGLIARDGVLTQSPTLDTCGGFANTVEDVALLADALSGGTSETDRPGTSLNAAATQTQNLTPSFALVHEPAWSDADRGAKDAISGFVKQLGTSCSLVDLPDIFDDALHQHRIVHYAEMAYAYRDYLRRGRERLFPATVGAMDAGASFTAAEYLAACGAREDLNEALDRIFVDYDAILTLAATGPAPKGLGTTGSPAFNALWTFCGTPAITLPLLTAPNGLPLGVQLVGRRDGDAKLLRSAAWLFERCGGDMFSFA